MYGNQRRSHQTVRGGINELGEAPAGAGPDLNATGPWKTFRGAGFTLQVPQNWRAFGNPSAAVIGPPGGIVSSSVGGAGRVVYGIITDLYRSQPGLSTATSLDALLGDLAERNPGFTAGPQTTITINGVVGRSVECSNPALNGGERDWVLAFPASDDLLRYFVFVAPAPDFARARPIFQRILQTLRLHT